MNVSNLYFKIHGWVDSVLNPPSTLEADIIPIIISDGDFIAPSEDSPFIVIGYTPVFLTPIGNGGTRFPVQEKNTPGYFDSNDAFGNLKNFYLVTDGELEISVDGEAVVNIPNMDFTEALSMTSVANILETEINNVLTSKRITVDFIRSDTKNYFSFVSVLKGSTSAVLITASVTGTDLLGVKYLNGGASVSGSDDTGTEQIFLTDYEADVEIRQCFGSGELLQKIIDSKWLNTTTLYFDKNKFSLNDIGPIQGIPFRDGHRTFKESMMSCKFSFFGLSKEDIYTIENIKIIGTLGNEDSSKSHIISIGG